MLVFPHWRPDMPSEGCRIQRWMPAERLAPYIARPVAVPSAPKHQVEDEDSSNSSFSERNEAGDIGDANVCGWKGCGLRFPSVVRLSAHVARVHAHAHSSGLFYCGWKGCTRPQRGFNARYKMLVHVRTHTNERPHTCTQCSKSFSRAENLKIHLRSHSGEKPYVCPYEGCGKAYSNSSDRFKHTRTHTVDKPYCCKVPGCNKRYTDPSSLRKHVKTYKHFTPKEISRQESSDELASPDYSPPRDTTYLEPASPLDHMPYSPAGVPPTYTPMVPMTDTLPPPLRYSPVLDQVTYLRPLEPVYPLRIPTHEMSYIEYTQMYEHAYRSYYSNSISYPVLTQTVCNKFNYEEINDVAMEMEVRERSPEMYTPVEEAPLNLKCMKRIEYTPIEDLVKRTDLPLDLSTKS